MASQPDPQDTNSQTGVELSRNIRNAVIKRLNHDYELLQSWRKVAAKYDVSTGMAFRVARQDYTPKDPQIRQKLGLLPNTIRRIECPTCGETLHYEISDGPCPYCNRHYLLSGEHIDHIVPRIIGGPDDGWNLIDCCSECNLAKNSLTPWQWFGEDWKPPQIYRKQFDAAKEFLLSGGAQETTSHNRRT